MLGVSPLILRLWDAIRRASHPRTARENSRQEVSLPRCSDMQAAKWQNALDADYRILASYALNECSRWAKLWLTKESADCRWVVGHDRELFLATEQVKASLLLQRLKPRIAVDGHASQLIT